MSYPSLTTRLFRHVSCLSADPNFLQLSARSNHELMMKESGFPGQWIRSRQEALLKFRDQLQEGSQGWIFLQKSE